MISEWDKAIVALIMAILSIVNLIWGVRIFGDEPREETVGVIVAVLTPILVWLVPNRVSRTATRPASHV